MEPVTQPPPYTKMPSDEVRADCRSFLLWVAQKYDVPPAFIVAHIRQVKVIKARREVMRKMLDWGLSRSQIALAFGRDLRRVRASVIGVPSKRAKKKRSEGWHDYARYDLFRQPLEQEKPRRAPSNANAAEAWELLAAVMPDHPRVIEWKRRQQVRVRR